ncbi:glycosyltransferase [Actinokineospora sp. NBRC 105648]|uniref:glycosyltransferase n=1 Tax=Actinokineospora sp. NBRC 105648 TaxID=3032206 RepID=UPI0024A1E152|nr:glycosyltransferase [Actinokineospora sp. NBRC 105648]GLZ42904.1 glycosyl transferase [Actinokineospora sp. NBRC 105648]
MKILFSSLAAHGHTYPMLPLAIAAKAHGHQVVFATHESFHRTLATLGFEPESAGTPVWTAFVEAAGHRPNPAELTGAEAGRLAAAVFGDRLPDGIATDLAPVLARHRPDLVVWGAANAGADIAARAAGIPSICHGFGRAGWPADLSEVAARHGVAPYEFSPGLVAGQVYLDIFPPSLQDKAFLDGSADRLPLRPVAFSEPGELPLTGRPLVYLTLGTAFGSPGVLRAAIDGLAATGVHVLVATGPTVDAAGLGPLPDRVTVQSWVPQADLLPRVDLVVHHGGAGTTLGAAAAGVPQLFLPQGADQFTNSDAVVGIGAGRALTREEVSAGSITGAAATLLDDRATALAARGLAEEIAAMPAPAAVAARLPEFA